MKSKFKIQTVGLLTCFTFALGALGTGCATDAKRTEGGAALGAGAGAILGGALGGGKGALIGGGAGALAGGVVGHYLDKQANELKQVADTKRTEDGVLVKLKNDLLFDTGKSDLKPEAIDQIGQLGDILAKYKSDRIEVAGYTDSTGSAKINQTLSAQRAEAVKNVLLQHGVQAAQINSNGLGPAQPVASNKTAKGRALNRRVELHIDVPTT